MGQTTEELQAHFGPDGPVQAVFSWLELVESNDDAALWDGLDEGLKLALAQDWVCTMWIYGPTDEAMAKAEDVAANGTGSADWATFQTEYLAGFKDRFADLHGDDIGSASKPRVVPPDLEVVLLLRTSAEIAVVKEDTPVMARMFLVRHIGGSWRIVNFHDRGPARTGWPPEFG